MHGFIINLALTGMVPTKQLNPHTPISVSEIVDTVLSLADLGVSIAHLHARDPVNGEPTNAPEIYQAILEGIRKYNQQVVLCVSLSGRCVSDPVLRAAPLHLDGAAKPDMGSLTLSSLNFMQQESMNSPKTIEYLASVMKEKWIAPELEAFDLGMVNAIHHLDKKKLLPEKPYANLIFGNMYGAQPSFSHFAAVVGSIPPGITSCCGGLGQFQTKTLMFSLMNGLGVRVGLEDNLWYDQKKSILASNTSLVKRVLAIADIGELSPCSAAETREALGLAGGNGRYGLPCAATSF